MFRLVTASLCALLFCFACEANDDPCSARSTLSYLFSEPESLTTANYEKLIRVSESNLVARAIKDETSVFHDLYNIVRKYDRRVGRKSISLGDKNFYLSSHIEAQTDTLVFTIQAINVKGISYGRKPKGLNSAFFKFTGSLLQAIDQNLSHVPNHFKSVKIIGDSIINRRLSETLAEFGFEAKTLPWEERLINTARGTAGLIKGTAVAKVSLAPFVLKAGSLPAEAKITPLVTGSLKKILNAPTFYRKGPSEKVAPQTWTIEIPLAWQEFRQ